MKYHVGDKVRVKTYGELKRLYSVDCTNSIYHDAESFTESMAEFGGSEYFIDEVHEDYYHLKGISMYHFKDWMLDDVIDHDGCEDCINFDDNDNDPECYCKGCKGFYSNLDPNHDKMPDLYKETPENASDVINHPAHYNHGMESIDEMVQVFGTEAVKAFCLCNVWKYRKRALYKNGEEDMKKSDWYMSKFVELGGGQA